MVTINGETFHSFPTYCNLCPFLLSWGTRSSRGTCTLFGIQKNKYSDLSRRCRELFEKAGSYPDGAELVIVQNTKNEKK